MMIMGDCVTGWIRESQRAGLSQQHPEGKYFGSKLHFVPCFLLTPSTQPYMEPRSMDSSLLPILKGFFVLFSLISSFTVGNLVFWLQSRMRKALTFTCFSALTRSSCWLLFLLSSFWGRTWVCSLPSLSFSYSLLFHPLPSAIPGLLEARCSLVLVYLF